MVDVSVAIATYNAGSFLRAAVESALAQTLRAIEVIIVDDGSSDDSVAIAQALAAEDDRVRLAATPRNMGPGGARNVALALARGRWFAVLDSDDIVMPGRFERLVALGERENADIVADDLMVFDSDGSAPPRPFLGGAYAGWIDLPAYLERTVIYGRTPDLGFLKPIVRTDRLRAAGIRYDEGLRIAEDDDLVVRMLMAGFRYRIDGAIGYLYRRHGHSISHRLSVADVTAMGVSSAARVAAATGYDARTRRAFARRNTAMIAAVALAQSISAMKLRRIDRAAVIAVRCPAMIPLLRMPIGGAWRKMFGRAQPSAETASPEQALAAAVRAAAAHSVAKDVL